MTRFGEYIYAFHISRNVAAGFVVLGSCILLVSCNAPDSPDDSELYERVVDGNVFDTTPVYGDALPLRLRRTGFEYKCSSCHTDFDHDLTANQPQGEHTELVAKFDHGRTIYCMSCHHQDDRDAYVDNLGRAMSAENSEELCARCHGPRFRDWEDGIHGRINGHWDAKYGERTKLTCVQCHDPHTPRFPLMKPSAPPIRSRLESSAEATHASPQKEAP